jgi:hypothetical protein
LAGHLDGLVAAEQLFENHPQLKPGQAGAEAEMRPAAAEGNVRIRVAPGVELLRRAASGAETGSRAGRNSLVTGWDGSSATVSCGASIGGRMAVLVMSQSGERP